MTSAPAIRALRRADADAIVRIDRQRSGRSRGDFYARQFETIEAEPRFFVALGAERDGRVVGFAFARILDGEFGGAAPVGVLEAIGVAEEEERKGIATALLSRTEAALSAQGVRELRTQADWTAHGMAAFLAAAGFQLSSRIVVERLLERPPDDEPDLDELPVRSMTQRDLPAVIRLDRKITGRDRSAYLTRKAREVLERSAIRMSLVAEVDGQVAGFLMARVDFGEFGRTEPISILDTIGVDPARARRGIGRALLDQLLLNLGSLRAERVVTEVDWNDVPFLAFLARTGFVHAQRLAFEKGIA